MLSVQPLRISEIKNDIELNIRTAVLESRLKLAVYFPSF